MGWPGYFGGASKAPFDILGDTLRGTREVIIDMYRRPEKVIAACERLVPVAVDWALKRPGGIATPVVFLPLHKGADGFMNDEQFHTFYWPTLRAVILGLIEEGCIPILFAEGRYGTRLEAIMDLPKGKTIWYFDQTDMAKAKKTIGQVACIEGNVPLSLIYAGTRGGDCRVRPQPHRGRRRGGWLHPQYGRRHRRRQGREPAGDDRHGAGIRPVLIGGQGGQEHDRGRGLREVVG